MSLKNSAEDAPLIGYEKVERVSPKRKSARHTSQKHMVLIQNTQEIEKSCFQNPDDISLNNDEFQTLPKQAKPNLGQHFQENYK